MYVTDQINSNESEGAFNEFVEEQLENLVDAILTEGDLENFGERGSDILVEMDDIVAPTFVYVTKEKVVEVVVEGDQVAVAGKFDSTSPFNT